MNKVLLTFDVCMPEGTVKSIDTTHEKYGWNLQIKSKYNSMNSSSAKKLAEQLEKLCEKRPEGIFGCGYGHRSAEKEMYCGCIHACLDVKSIEIKCFSVPKIS